MCLCGESSAQIPLVGRPAEDFYNAAGSDVRVTTTAEPDELTTDDFLTLTLTIENLANPREVRRPDLRQLPAFAERFQVEDAPDPPGAVGPDRRVFVYRLRPRSTEVREVPWFDFRYYDPKRKEHPDPKRRFRFTSAGAIPIRVRPRRVEPPPAVPLEIPAFAETLAPAEEVLAGSGSRGWPRLAWLPALLGPPVPALAWLVLAPRLFPDGARRARRRQSRAARWALRELHRAGRRPGEEWVSASAEVLAEYLHRRFDLPPHARTPAEVDRSLRGVEALSPERIDAVADFLRECDAARFAPAPPAGGERFPQRAAELVRALEEAE